MTNQSQRRLNYCLGGTGAPTQGGMDRANRATCPTCGKRIRINRNGQLRAHGTQPVHSPEVRVRMQARAALVKVEA